MAVLPHLLVSGRLGLVYARLQRVRHAQAEIIVVPVGPDKIEEMPLHLTAKAKGFVPLAILGPSPFRAFSVRNSWLHDYSP